MRPADNIAEDLSKTAAKECAFIHWRPICLQRFQAEKQRSQPPELYREIRLNRFFVSEFLPAEKNGKKYAKRFGSQSLLRQRIPSGGTNLAGALADMKSQSLLRQRIPSGSRVGNRLKTVYIRGRLT